MNKHGLSITVLEQQAREYETIAFNGQYRYGDPESEIKMWKTMAQQCREGAEALKGLS
jgi:hypothetical protein